MAEIVPQADPKPASAAVAHTDALPAGTRLGEFEIQGLLGVGGFGLVYRAYDTSLQRAVAIKEYMPAALAARLDGTSVSVRSSGDAAAYQTGLQSFIAEARLLAQFDHPSLVKVYRFWETNNTAYMVMPLYSGVTLKQARTQMSAPPPEEWLRTVLWSVLQALHVLHRNGALHRDISPDNIFLQDVGPPVLLDLGAARRAITDKSQKLTTVLKVNYAPIEQFAEAEDLKQGPWTDLYALAAVVYSCLRNDPPLPATARAVRDSLPPVKQIVAAVKQHFGLAYSEPFVRTIQHALAVQPTERPANLAAFVTEMKLKAPPRLSKFDWRAELGGSLQGEQEEYNSRQFSHTVVDLGVAEGAGAEPVPSPRRRSSGLRAGLWLAGLLVIAGLAWALLGPVARPGGEVAAPAPAVEPEAPPPLAAASEPAPVVPEPVVSAAPVVQTPMPEVAHRRVVTPPKPVLPKPAAAPVDEERKPVSRPAPAVAAPKVDPQPASVSKELCASASFFSKSMCIYQECRKPENAQLPVCIEDRQRYQDQGPGS